MFGLFTPSVETEHHVLGHFRPFGGRIFGASLDTSSCCVSCVSRGTGVGVVLALGCVGRLSSPLMDLRNHYGYFLHHVVYSSLALLAVLSILLLPESKRKTLPQTLADGEQYRRPPLGRRRRDNVPLLVTPNPET